MPKLKNPRFYGFLWLIFISLFSIVSINAATLTVTKTADTNDGACDSDCSLREAVAQANIASDSDEIVFDPVFFSTPQTITLTGGQINITISTATTINGPGAELLTISGNNQSRIFFPTLFGTNVTISNLTMAHGFSNNGGAIRSDAFLVLSNVILRDNRAEGFEVTQAGFQAGLGGGIYSTGTLVIYNSTLSNNIASGVLIPTPNAADYGSAGGGGALYSHGVQTTVVNCRFIDNQAKGISGANTAITSGGGAYGGAIYGLFNVSVFNSTFTGNSALAGSGGTAPNGITGNAGESLGGAIYSSGSQILNSTFTNNTATGGNGGNVSGNGGRAIGGAVIDYNVKIANSTIVNNTATGGSGFNGGNAQGGGVYGGGHGWSLVNSTITGNSVGGGSGTLNNGLKLGGGVFSSPDTGSGSSFKNNIVAENTAASGTDVGGTYINAAYNVIGVGEGATGITNGVNGNLVGTAAVPVNPMLAALADNGGFAETRALLEGSPAINAGNTASAINPFTSQVLQSDQRGFQRIAPAGGQVDVGAFEFGASIVPAATAPDLQNASDTGFNNADNITRARTAVFTVSNAMPGAVVELLRDGIVVASRTATNTNGTVSVTDANPPLDGVAAYTSRQTVSGTVSAVSPSITVTFDNTAPTVTINQASGQSDPTRIQPVNFEVAFSEPIDFFSSSNVSFAGSTANMSTAIITTTFTTSTTYSVAVRNVTANFLKIIAGVPASTNRDLAGNFNLASTSTDNVVTLDNVVPNVTINQSVAQADPTLLQPVNFTAVFSENVTGFNAADVSLAGSTANVSAAVITVTGNGSTYNISIGNITSGGQVRAAIPAGAAADSLGNSSTASSSLDNTITVNIPNRSQLFDFDGDGKTDISIFRPSVGEWWINRSSSEQTVAAQFGLSTDKTVPADFTGDGKADIAFWRPASGEWFILRSEDGSFLSFPFGASGDVPLVGDFDGDGRADPTVYRPSTNEWFILKSTGGTSITTFGAAGDVPAMGDYDGDGKTDLAIYRPAAGEWWIQRSLNSSVYAFQFGVSTDKPVPGDYTGDGKTDAAFFRPSTGEWFILRSEDSSFYSVPFGADGDLPAAGDYDGDGKFDTAVFRPSTSTWYINRSTAGVLITDFGVTGDQPLPNTYVP